MKNVKEPLENLFSKSRLLILDFNDISPNTKTVENISLYFRECLKKGVDPKLPENRQKFNNSMLNSTGARYLVSRYGENRASMLAGSSISKENRTIHLGIDIFCKNLETVYAPFDGDIVISGNEPENHSFGYYLILKPQDKSLPFFFFGHLSANTIKLGKVKAGDPIAVLGDFINHENGGWSRHLHLQAINDFDPNNIPLGYSSIDKFKELSKMYPDPLKYFPSWDI